MTITSPHNPRLKELRKLQRARERAQRGLFAVEGEDLVLAARAAGRKAVEGFRAPGAGVVPEGARIPSERTGILDEGFHEVDPAALAKVSTLGSGTRVIAVYEQRWGPPAGPLCVYLHGVADPGNVGTVRRSAAALGASSVALGPGCADPHSPKALRASMGAIFTVALARVQEVSELPGERVALAAGRGEPLWQVHRDQALGQGFTLLVGSERAGLPADVLQQCERVAHIPIATESLNAAMAATVALYELRRHSTTVSAS
jgi:RNA methyltransferase, TrmH family